MRREKQKEISYPVQLKMGAITKKQNKNATDYTARPAAAIKKEIRTSAMAASRSLSAVGCQASASFQLAACILAAYFGNSHS
jgi:hypothetical protein